LSTERPHLETARAVKLEVLTSGKRRANLLDLLLDWVPSKDVRRKILVENPPKLYF
jgi:hypothetical protein